MLASEVYEDCCSYDKDGGGEKGEGDGEDDDVAVGGLRRWVGVEKRGDVGGEC